MVHDRVDKIKIDIAELNDIIKEANQPQTGGKNAKEIKDLQTQDL